MKKSKAISIRLQERDLYKIDQICKDNDTTRGNYLIKCHEYIQDNNIELDDINTKKEVKLSSDFIELIELIEQIRSDELRNKISQKVGVLLWRP